MMVQDDILRFRLINVMQHWITQHRQDFNKEKETLVPILENFFKAIIENDQMTVFKTFAHVLPQKWKEQRTLIQIKKAGGQNLMAAPPPIIPLDEVLDIWSVDPEEMARQLTLLDECHFRNIPPWEFLNQSWVKRETREEKAPHICKMIKRFNQVSQWIRGEIVTELNQKRRSEILGRFIETAGHLQKLNNFNSLMQILAALNSLPVFRLKKTWNSLSKKFKAMWASLETIFDVRVMRRCTQHATHPIIPFLGMYLSDLTLIEENADMTEDGQINFAKRALLARTMAELGLYQQTWYSLQPLPEVQEWLIQLSPIEDDELLEAFSYYIELKKGTEQGEMPQSIKDYIFRKPPSSRDKKKIKATTK